MAEDALLAVARGRIEEYGKHCKHWYGYNHKMDSITFAFALLAGLVPIASALLVTDLMALKWITSVAGLISAATVAVRSQFYWEAKTKFYGRACAECDKLLDQLVSIETKEQVGALIALLGKLRDDETALSSGTSASSGITNAMDALRAALKTSASGQHAGGAQTPKPE